MKDRKVFNIIFDWIDGKVEATVIQVGERNILMNKLSAEEAQELLTSIAIKGGSNE